MCDECLGVCVYRGFDEGRGLGSGLRDGGWQVVEIWGWTKVVVMVGGRDGWR